MRLNREEPIAVVLDIGGEGRHPEAWNLNPSSVRTLGRNRGSLIPKHIRGRAEHIPFADRSVALIIVERTPLRLLALREIARVIASEGTIMLRHARPPRRDPHAYAISIIPGRISQRVIRLNCQMVQETRIQMTRR